MYTKIDRGAPDKVQNTCNENEEVIYGTDQLVPINAATHILMEHRQGVCSLLRGSLNNVPTMQHCDIC